MVYRPFKHQNLYYMYEKEIHSTTSWSKPELDIFLVCVNISVTKFFYWPAELDVLTFQSCFNSYSESTAAKYKSSAEKQDKSSTVCYRNN